jgi:hypothetical protein
MQDSSRRSTRHAARLTAIAALAVFATLALAGSAAAQGSFVIGDGNASVGSSVTFWGAQWWKLNALSGGPAPASFKGFADSAETTPACGESWTTRPGNSSSPPQGPLPPFVEVIVASEISKSGPTISGDTTEVALVETEPGYAPNPGHAGTGTVVAILCGGSGGGVGGLG